jgi:predicted alpha/beta-hydrolase family hydrolase
MKEKKISIHISPEAGSVTGEYFLPEKSICMMVMAHGAGAGMQHPFMTDLATALAGKNISTLRFNFLFTENGKKRPDSPTVAHAAIEAALHQAQKQAGSLPVFLSGKSFGGRMSSQYLSMHHDNDVKGIIFFGFPLHAPGAPSIDRAAHLKDVKKPMLFLSGTRDEFARLGLLEKVCSSLSKTTLVKIEGANHGFKAGKLNVIELLAEETVKWVRKK